MRLIDTMLIYGNNQVWRDQTSQKYQCSINRMRSHKAKKTLRKVKNFSGIVDESGTLRETRVSMDGRRLNKSRGSQHLRKSPGTTRQHTRALSLTVRAHHCWTLPGVCCAVVDLHLCREKASMKGQRCEGRRHFLTGGNGGEVNSNSVSSITDESSQLEEDAHEWFLLACFQCLRRTQIYAFLSLRRSLSLRCSAGPRASCARSRQFCRSYCRY